MPIYDNQIKRPGEEHSYTIEQVKDLKKCKDDLFYFMNFVKLIHPDKGRIIFKPYPFQKKMLNLLVNNRFVVILCARQQGKSLSVGTYALWYALFNDDKVIGIVSNKETSAIDFLTRVKIQYEELPFWLKCGVVEYNKKSIVFENGTTIVAGATSKNAFRGKTANIIISDELAFVDHGKAEDFYMSNYPTISVSEQGQFIAISTPNGIGGLFYELYIKAEQRQNEFIHFKADWTVHPERGEKWKKTQLKNLGKRRFAQEYEVEFLGSTSTIIDKDNLLRLSTQKTYYPIEMMNNEKFRIYEKPIKEYDYIIGVDPAKGTGEHYSTIQVIKIISIKPLKLKQVAVFEDNFTDTYKFAHIINKISIYYNDGYIMCENNGEGSAVISELHWNLEIDNLINSGSKEANLGIRATSKTKLKAVLLMKKIIEDQCIKIIDDNTISQLLTFIDKGNNKFGGDGNEDDLISALYWALFIFEMDILDETKEFKEKEDDDIWDILIDNDIPEGYEILQR
jgi:hypothetical protein